MLYDNKIEVFKKTKQEIELRLYDRLIVPFYQRIENMDKHDIKLLKEKQFLSG